MIVVLYSTVAKVNFAIEYSIKVRPITMYMYIKVITFFVSATVFERVPSVH